MRIYHITTRVYGDQTLTYGHVVRAYDPTHAVTRLRAAGYDGQVVEFTDITDQDITTITTEKR